MPLTKHSTIPRDLNDIEPNQWSKNALKVLRQEWRRQDSIEVFTLKDGDDIVAIAVLKPFGRTLGLGVVYSTEFKSKHLRPMFRLLGNKIQADGIYHEVITFSPNEPFVNKMHRLLGFEYHGVADNGEAIWRQKVWV